MAAFSTSGQPTWRPKPSTSARVATGVNGGTGTPMADRRSRMTTLSWACRSAADPGAIGAPSASRASSSPPGTCSWSKVTTSQPAAKARRSSSEVCSPTTTPAATSAALSCVESASTRTDSPSPMAAWWVIRDS